MLRRRSGPVRRGAVGGRRCGFPSGGGGVGRAFYADAQSYAELRYPCMACEVLLQGGIYGTIVAYDAEDLDSPALVEIARPFEFPAGHDFCDHGETITPVEFLDRGVVSAVFAMRHMRGRKMGLLVLGAFGCGIGLFFLRNLAQVLGDNGGILAQSLAAGSFKDGTRVAGTTPELVRQMCETNAPALVDALADHVAALRAAGNLPAPRKKRRSRKKATKVDKA